LLGDPNRRRMALLGFRLNPTILQAYRRFALAQEASTSAEA